MKTKRRFLDSLYTIENTGRDNNYEKIIIRIRINPLHEIFKGHFPGNPLLPGACTVQIIKELVEHVSEKDLMISDAGTIKYISFINPEEIWILDIDLQLKEKEEGRLFCNASVYSGEKAFCSFKGTFIPVAGVRGD
jgi:3-hydroxyacyl-[acyl-carrier-protein] dehydratase